MAPTIKCAMVLLLWISVFMVTDCGAAERAGEARQRGVAMRVLWTVGAYRLTPNSAWGDEEARKMLFKPLDITPSSITFDGRSCQDVAFYQQEVDAGSYLMGKFQISQQSLKITDKTFTVITTDCSLDGFSEYIRLTDRRLLVSFQGVLFFFNPKVNY